LEQMQTSVFAGDTTLVKPNKSQIKETLSNNYQI
jgi:hypothetical protein